MVRVAYIALRLDICPPIQEEGDGCLVVMEDSRIEGGPSILQQGHTGRQTDRQTNRQTDDEDWKY